MKQGFAQLAGQLWTIWKQLGLNQRISVVLATGAVLAGLIGVAVFSSRTSYGLLFSGLPDAEVARAVAALEEAKVPYQIRGSGSIYVPAEKAPALRAQLAVKGISGSVGEGGYKIFEKNTWGQSDFMQRVMFTLAIEGELARTIGQLDGIESARVGIAMPQNRLLMDPQKKTTASVLLKVRGSGLTVATVGAIRNLVASSVEGLKPNNVSVMDQTGKSWADPDEAGSTAGAANGKLDLQQKYEDYFTRKVRNMLDAVLGLNQSQVVITAEIDWNTETTYLTMPDPEKTVPVTTTTTKKTVQSTTAQGGGVAGVASNTPSESTNSAPTTSQMLNRTTDDTVTTQSEVGRTVSSILKDAGSIKRLSASVILAQRFEGTGTARRAVPRGTNELQNLRDAVRDAIGIQEGETVRNDRISLTEMPFNDQPVVELTQKMDRDQTRRFWVDLGLKLLYPALALLVVAMFWRSLKGTKVDDITIGIPLGELAMAGGDGNGNGNGNGNGHGYPGRSGRKNEPKVVTVEVLNQLIRENPANMTQAVRNWLVRGKPAK